MGQLEAIKPLIAQFEEDPVSFFYIDKEKESFIHKDVFASSKAVLFKPKRKKYMPVTIDSITDLESRISNALGGGGSF